MQIAHAFKCDRFCIYFLVDDLFFFFFFLSSVFTKPLIIHSVVRRSFRHLIAWNCNVQFFFHFVYLWEFVSTSGKCILNISLAWSSARSAMSESWWEIWLKWMKNRTQLTFVNLLWMFYPSFSMCSLSPSNVATFLLMGHFKM